MLRTLRVAKINTPIMILSGTAEIDTKVKTLGGGADDYMTKPFHKEELVARIHAVVRRSKGHAQSVIQTGDIIVNLDAKTVEVNGMRVHLTGKEYQMLELLSLRKGTTLTKEMFLNHLYGGMDEPELKIIDVFICKLRKKLAAAADGRTTSRPSGAAAMCCATRTRSKSAFPPDRKVSASLYSSQLPTGPRREWRGFRFGDPCRRHHRQRDRTPLAGAIFGKTAASPRLPKTMISVSSESCLIT